MNIFLYKYDSERNRLDKTFEQVSQRVGTLKTSTGLLKLEILLKADSRLLSANYCYIAEFNRYYFIDDIEVQHNGVALFKMSQDVLMSHREDIKRMTVEVVESVNPNDNFMSCDLQSEKTLLKSERLNNPFTSRGVLYMLTVQGA